MTISAFSPIPWIIIIVIIIVVIAKDTDNDSSNHSKTTPISSKSINLKPGSVPTLRQETRKTAQEGVTNITPPFKIQ